MLTEPQSRRAKPDERQCKLHDALGLYLLITRSGAKSWRFKYRIGRIEKRLKFAIFPKLGTVSIADVTAPDTCF